MDVLGTDSGKQFLTYIVGVFVAVGLGYGIGLVLLDAVSDEAGAVIGFFALLVPVLSAPIISMATGLLTGLRLNTDRQSAALVSGVGAFIGFLVLLFVLIIFAGIVGDGNGGTNGANGDGSLSDLFGPLFAFGTGVAVTGAVATYVVKRIDI